MITDVNCGLLLQITCQLVNQSTRQLQIMITDVNCGLREWHEFFSNKDSCN